MPKLFIILGVLGVIWASKVKSVKNDEDSSDTMTFHYDHHYNVAPKSADLKTSAKEQGFPEEEEGKYGIKQRKSEFFSTIHPPEEEEGGDDGVDEKTGELKGTFNHSYTGNDGERVDVYLWVQDEGEDDDYAFDLDNNDYLKPGNEIHSRRNSGHTEDDSLEDKVSGMERNKREFIDEIDIIGPNSDDKGSAFFRIPSSSGGEASRVNKPDGNLNSHDEQGNPVTRDEDDDDYYRRRYYTHNHYYYRRRRCVVHYYHHHYHNHHHYHCHYRYNRPYYNNRYRYCGRNQYCCYRRGYEDSYASNLLGNYTARLREEQPEESDPNFREGRQTGAIANITDHVLPGFIPKEEPKTGGNGNLKPHGQGQTITRDEDEDDDYYRRRYYGYRRRRYCRHIHHHIHHHRHYHHYRNCRRRGYYGGGYYNEDDDGIKLEEEEDTRSVPEQPSKQSFSAPLNSPERRRPTPSQGGGFQGQGGGQGGGTESHQFNRDFISNNPIAGANPWYRSDPGVMDEGDKDYGGRGSHEFDKDRGKSYKPRDPFI